MKTYTIQLEDEQQYQRLLALAQQAGIEVVADSLAVLAPTFRPLPDVSHLTAEELREIIQRGGDGKSISDPLNWQRNERAGWDERLATHRS